MKTSVIFTTYNSPVWLEKVLWGFFEQTRKDVEIVIADDGSTEETADLIRRVRKNSRVPIKHIWQPDEGFQKCRALNKAIAASEGEYLIFTDGDCIPRRDFVEQHLHHAHPERYLSGGYFKLPLAISQAIDQRDVQNQSMFSPAWLKSHGMEIGVRRFKLNARGWVGEWLNKLIPVKPTWNGHNASCYKNKVIAVNGFNEDMQYGGEDVEFGMRLQNAGLKPKRIRFSTICVHLEHRRGYVTAEMLEKNSKIIDFTQNQKIKWTPHGVDQYL